MGIIISCFKGCGREFFKNTYNDKVSIFDAAGGLENALKGHKLTDDVIESYFNKVMDSVNDYDVVFITPIQEIRDFFNENKIDYDIFYPSKERRNEFLENFVRKGVNHDEIREMDLNFEKWIDEIDNDDSPNCYKHKLSNNGEFIGNAPIIMQYINILNNNKKKENNNNE